MNHSVSKTGRRKTSPGPGKTLPVMSRANPTDRIKVKTNALHARKRESASPQARTNAQPIKTSNGNGSRDQPTDPGESGDQGHHRRQRGEGHCAGPVFPWIGSEGVGGHGDQAAGRTCDRGVCTGTARPVARVRNSQRRTRPRPPSIGRMSPRRRTCVGVPCRRSSSARPAASPGPPNDEGSKSHTSNPPLEPAVIVGRTLTQDRSRLGVRSATEFANRDDRSRPSQGGGQWSPARLDQRQRVQDRPQVAAARLRRHDPRSLGL